MRERHPVEIILKGGISIAVGIGIIVRHIRIQTVKTLPPVRHSIFVGVEISGTGNLFDSNISLCIPFTVDKTTLASLASHGGSGAIICFGDHSSVVSIEQREVATHVREHISVSRFSALYGSKRLKEWLIIPWFPRQLLSARQFILIRYALSILRHGSICSHADVTTDVSSLRTLACSLKLMAQEEGLGGGRTHLIVIVYEV